VEVGANLEAVGAGSDGEAGLAVLSVEAWGVLGGRHGCLVGLLAFVEVDGDGLL
jgi:hypothetical protein